MHKSVKFRLVMVLRALFKVTIPSTDLKKYYENMNFIVVWNCKTRSLR